jgi:DNA-binding transcriptional LysR family regulator
VSSPSAYSLTDHAGIYRVFVELAERRSFAAAGRHLGMTASAVGKAVHRYEVRLGVRLVNRTTRSVSLTAEGTQFLYRCHCILDEMDAAEHDLRVGLDRPSGRLKLSLPLLSEPFVSVLARFQQTFPEVSLELDFTDRVVNLVEEGFDAVIRTGPLKDSSLKSKPLGSFRMVLVAAHTYLTRYGTPGSPAEVLKHHRIQFRSPASGKLQAWPGAGDSSTALEPAIVCNSTESRLAFALQGIGLAYVPDFSVRDLLTEGQLVVLLDQEVTATERFHLLWPSSRQRTAKVRALADFLGQHLRLTHIATP